MEIKIEGYGVIIKTLDRDGRLKISRHTGWEDAKVAVVLLENIDDVP